MGSRELIESLHREAEERAQKIRGDAETEAREIRDKAGRETEALALKYRTEESEAVRERMSEITAEAEAESRALRVQASEELIGRLHTLAFSSLQDLRAANYAGVFRALAAEIPAHAWKVVRVNPADEGLASGVFTGTVVEGDDRISGGMEVVTEDGRMNIINTFEKRLERAWEEILPPLIKEAYDACDAGD